MTAALAIEQHGMTADHWATVEANLGLIGHVLHTRCRFVPPSEQEDAWADGVLGLCRAAQMFDPERGFRFSTYAHGWIRQAIQRGHEQRRGKAYRRALATGDPLPEKVLSTDVEIADGMTVLDFVGADGVERAVEARAALDAQVSAMRALARDAIDRDLVDSVGMLLAGNRRRLYEAVAARHAISQETVRRRWLRLVDEARAVAA